MKDPRSQTDKNTSETYHFFHSSAVPIYIRGRVTQCEDFGPDGPSAKYPEMFRHKNESFL